MATQDLETNLVRRDSKLFGAPDGSQQARYGSVCCSEFCFGVVLLILYLTYKGTCWERMNYILMWGVIFQMGILPAAHMIGGILLLKTNITVTAIWHLIINAGRVVFYIFVYLVFFNAQNDCKSNATALWVAVLLLVINGAFAFLYCCCGTCLVYASIKAGANGD